MNRAGHKLPGQTPKYIYQMQRGGDEFCSRVCAGLDIQDNNFGILPPHFREAIVEDIPWSDFVWNYKKMDPAFRSVVPYCIASLVWQCKKGWVKKNLPDNHPIWSSQFILHRFDERLEADTDLHCGHLFCSDCGMRATGIPAQVRLSYEIAGIAAQQRKQMDLLQELLGTGNRPLSQIISEEVKAKIVEDGASLRESLFSKFDEVKASIDEGFEAIATSDVIARRRTSLHLPALPDEPVDMPSPTYSYEGGEDKDERWMCEEEEDRSVATQMAKYCVHWWTKDGETQQRLHPVPFPINVVGKLPIATLWALWHRTSDNALLPPYKLLRVFDVSRATEKNFYKAKSVCEVMYDHLIRLNALPNDKVLSDCSLEELKMQCDRGVQEIVAGHNAWLKKEWEKEDPAKRSPFKPFKGRKLSGIAYTTLHKYLHRGNVSDDGSDTAINDA